MKIELADEFIDSITVQNLKESYYSAIDDIKRLEFLKTGPDGLQDYQKEDLKADYKMEKHLRKVINYYSLRSDYIEKFKLK